MGRKVFSALIMLLIFIPIMYFGGVLFNCFIYIIGLLELHEFLSIRDRKKNLPVFIKVLSFIVFSILMCANVSYVLSIDFKFLTCCFSLFLISTIIYKSDIYSVNDAFSMIGVVLLLGISNSIIIHVRNISMNISVYLFLIGIICDVCAYIIGSLFGRTKLCDISPCKTIEGMISGVILGTFIPVYYYLSFINSSNIIYIIFMTLFLCIIGVIGDLCFSGIKRYFVVKDFSNLIPGHGGVLDRFDSIIFIMMGFMLFLQEVNMTLIYMILILGIIVFIHEFGHFLFAKKAGIYVYEFSLGMGPRLLKFNRKNDETEYSLRLLPIGGYVQMAGEEVEVDTNIPENMRMQSKSWMQKFLTIIAGIMFNFILSIVVFFIVGLVNGASQNKPYINYIEDGVNSNVVSVGDRIVAVNGKKVIFTDLLVLDVQLNSGKPLNLTVLNESGKRDVVLNPIEVNENGKVSYKYGIGLGDEIKSGVLPSIGYAFSKFASLFFQMILVVFNLIVGKLGLSSMSGPIGIFNVVGESARAGLINIVYLIGFISLNVGFMNLLPIPALDGGRILFLIIEKIKGSSVDVKVENTIHTIGFALLMILMVVITFNDILKLLQGDFMCDISFSYEDDDIVSDTILNFYNSCDCKEKIFDFINLYINDKNFYNFVQKNFLVKKISDSYLIRLYNDYDSDSIVDEYDYITSVSTTRWI